MTRPIAFDLTRMFIGAAGATPRGIDRVDMGLAEHLFSDEMAGHVGLIPWARGMGVLTSQEAARLAGLVSTHWAEARSPDDDALFIWVKSWLAGQGDGARPHRPASPNGQGSLVGRYAAMTMQARFAPFRTASLRVPRNAVYLNVGQVLLGWGWFFRWLEQRPDIRPVFMMHDVIPILYPEYSGPVLSRHHARAVDTIARRAAALLATSHASAAEIRQAVAARGRSDLPIHVVPLPVSRSLLVDDPPDPDLMGADYFVTVGILDQRKNQQLLLHVWRRMLAERRRSIPKLLIIGSQGLRTGSLLDFIRRSPGLSEHVLEVHGLPSQAMRGLIRGAKALLMPSFTEGFGLPIVEAHALGTPVIASDIPAHREVGGAKATYLHPLDGPAWLGEILNHQDKGRPRGDDRGAGLDRGAPQTWANYLGEVMPFLESIR